MSERDTRREACERSAVHRAGADVDPAPGDFSMLSYLDPPDRVLVHTDHLVAPLETVVDVSQWAMQDSLARYQRLSRALERAPRPVTGARLQSALGDHADHPSGLCCHPDPREHPAEQGETIMSTIMDPHDCVMWLADGNPCGKPCRRIDYADFRAKPPAALRPSASGVSALERGA